MPPHAYTDAELEAAVAALNDEGALRDAQDVVMRTAPGLQRVLVSALSEGGWFGPGHDQAIREAAAAEEPADRERELRTLIAEEARLGMLVGVAVGFQLARELDRTDAAHEPDGPDTTQGD